MSLKRRQIGREADNPRARKRGANKKEREKKKVDDKPIRLFPSPIPPPCPQSSNSKNKQTNNKPDQTKINKKEKHKTLPPASRHRFHTYAA
jgi:hypothetical protein